MAPAAGPGWEEPTSQLDPSLRPELDYVLTHEHSWGRRVMIRSFYWRTRVLNVTTRRNESRPLAGILELALRAISLRHSARSVVTGSQRIGRTSTLISVASGMLAALRLAGPWWSSAPRRLFTAGDDEPVTSERPLVAVTSGALLSSLTRHRRVLRHSTPNR